MDQYRNQLIVFARVPKLGYNKTRLIPALGAQQATEVYRALAAHTLASIRQLDIPRETHVTVQFTGGTIDEARATWGSDLSYIEQAGAALGEKLSGAILAATQGGACRATVIGTDCPTLTVSDLRQAFAELDEHDVVLGPATDGGYYLIGVKQHHPHLFADIDWSTARVLEQTLARAKSLGLRTHLLRRLPDVDYPEDLLTLRKSGAFEQLPIQSQAGRLSIVIPTLNEAVHLPATLAAVGVPAEDLEVIVVDGGSSDTTGAIAEQHGCRFFIGNRGRARQMNAGAAIATGENLLFLHADTILPNNYRSELESVLRTPVQCGAFSLRIDAPGFGMRIVEAGTAVRSKFLQMPYGDQALFFRSADFYALEGFKSLAIMEDYEMMTRMRKRGRIGVAKACVRTSGRRWQKRGIVKTTLINQLCVLAFRIGFSDTTIARIYRGRPSVGS